MGYYKGSGKQVLVAHTVKESLSIAKNSTCQHFELGGNGVRTYILGPIHIY